MDHANLIHIMFYTIKNLKEKGIKVPKGYVMDLEMGPEPDLVMGVDVNLKSI
jgi:hypothetical protein